MRNPHHGRRRPLIGVVVPALELGGGVPAVAEFVCQTIERSGSYDLVLISLSSSAHDEIGVGLRQPTSWLHGVRTGRGIWNERPFVRVGTFLSELEFQRFRPRRALAQALSQCDLVQVVCGSPAWGLAARGLGKPVAVQCATRALVERRRQQATGRGLKALWRRWMTRITDELDDKALRSADAIQVENPWMFDYAQELNAGRTPIIRYAPPGVDATFFAPASRRTLFDDPYILCVGRLDDVRKNVGLLLDAYAQLPENLVGSVRLLLAGAAGPGPEFWEEVRHRRLEGRVSFIKSPSPDELLRLYQNAAIFASSSDEEGLGMAILEAMACGIPVVSTRSGGPDGIIDDGVDGYLVPIDDATAMADRFVRLLTNAALNNDMGEAARTTILRRYEAGVAGEAFLDIYDELLALRRART